MRKGQFARGQKKIRIPENRLYSCTTINIADKRAYFNSSAAKNGNFSPGIEVPLEKKGTGCYNMTMSS
jgi:hypothetical protein